MNIKVPAPAFKVRSFICLNIKTWFPSHFRPFFSGNHSTQHLERQISQPSAHHTPKPITLKPPHRLLAYTSTSLRHIQDFNTFKTSAHSDPHLAQELHVLVRSHNMKLNTLINSGTSLLMLAAAASESPTIPVLAAPNTTAQPIITPGTGHVNLGEEVPPGRAREEQADQYLFNTTLESFITLRDQRYPSYFWWESDGCSQSPDAPFGFPFLPACYRHDFGYDQYKKVCTTKTLSLVNIGRS